MSTAHKLNSKWTVWFRKHDDKDWSINSYKKVFTFETIEEYWGLIECIKRYDDMIFIMRGDILPIYEDDKNINGGQLSYVTKMYDVKRNFIDLGVHIIAEQLCNEMSQITGFSLSLKRSTALLKVWFSDFDKFSGGVNDGSIKFKIKSPPFSRFKMRKHIN